MTRRNRPAICPRVFSTVSTGCTPSSRADVPIDVPIATGIPEAAFATFDTHAKRNVRRMGARVDDRVMAAAAKLLWKEENGFPPTGAGNTPSVTEIIQTLDAHPDLAARLYSGTA